MLDTFGINTVARCFYPEDFYNNPNLSCESYRYDFLSSTIDLIDDSELFKSHIEKKQLNKKPIYSIGCLKRSLLLRQCSKNIKSSYRIDAPDRHRAISFLMDFLSQKTPMVVHKIDIKSFFESCNFETILEGYIRKFRFNDSYKIISSLYQEYKSIDGEGLPRGIPISSTLSEIFMSDFDSEVKAMDGVLYYYRYVDDIIIISNGLNGSGFTRKVKDLLYKKGLCVNPGKCMNIDLTQYSKSLKAVNNNKFNNKVSFDFLGYTFVVETDIKIGNSKKVKEFDRKIDIEISKSKVNRLKYKITRSLLDYKETKDESLLVDRMNFLSTNRKIKNRSGDVPIMTGLSYSYRFVDNPVSLIDVDRYFRCILLGNSRRIGNSISDSMNDELKNHLNKISFYNRFKNKVFKSFSPNRMEEIVSLWK